MYNDMYSGPECTKIDVSTGSQQKTMHFVNGVFGDQLP